MQIDIAKIRKLMEERRITQTELALRSGISRPWIVALLKLGTASVQAQTGRRICEALGLPVTALDKEGVEAAYLERLAQHHEMLDFTGLGIVSALKPLSLERGFAQPRLREWREAQGLPADPSTASRIAGPLAGQAHEFPLGHALARSPRFFLLGDPGSGKTTALRHVARTYATGAQRSHNYPAAQLIPIFVRLADWAEHLRTDENADPVDAAIAQLRGAEVPEITAWLRAQAGKANSLLLLDGLDEVADPEYRSRIVEKIRSFFGKYPDVRAVISSRVVGFEAPNLGATLDAFQVQPLSPPAIEAFVSGWCALRHGHDAQRRCAECDRRSAALRHAIMNHPQIRPLAGNPMMLTILSLLHEAGTSLPQRRWELYQKIAEAFLFSWQEKKRMALSGAPDRGLKLEDREVLWILESLALEMQRKDRTLVARWWLSEHVCSFLRDELGFNPDTARATTDALIWSLHERSGLLIERGPGQFGFSHLAFQEYFASRAVLAGDDPIKALQPYLYHPRWREVVRLVAAQLDRQRVPQVMRMILDDPDATGRLVHRGLLLALSCLADGAPVHDGGLLSQMSQDLGGMARRRCFTLTMEAMFSLAALRETRLAEFAGQAATAILDGATAASGAVDPVTLLLVAAFRGLLEKGDGWQGVGPGQRFPAIRERAITVDGRSGTVMQTTSVTGLDGQWVGLALEQLGWDTSPGLRATCASQLARFVGAPEVRQRLLASLREDGDSGVRRAVAAALGAGLGDTDVRHMLMMRMESDPDPSVRGTCATVLGQIATQDSAVQAALVSALGSQAPALVRAGAANGLWLCVGNAAHVRALLLEAMTKADEDFQVRIAAAKALALYAAADRVNWTELPMEMMEQLLTSPQAPYAEVLPAVRALLDARERRKMGIPREARILRALSALRERVKVMFIFGSYARGEQDAESDIDLLIIGDVSLRELTPGLKQAEQELGRQVNIAVYSEKDWRERCLDGNPFVTGVLKGQKVFIVGGPDELGAVAGQRVDH